MGKDIYEDFLRLTGFEEDEMPKYLPEWRKASEKLRLTEDDVRFATEGIFPEHRSFFKLSFLEMFKPHRKSK